jgi:WD40 repeat protein
MVTGSMDSSLRLWDLRTGALLKNMEGHRSGVRTLAVSPDGQLIASGDESGVLITWHGESGEPFTKVKAHYPNWLVSLDFSPDGTGLATGSSDKTTKIWSTTTWQSQGNPFKCSDPVHCVRYSPSGELLAIATSSHIEIYDLRTKERVAKFKAHSQLNLSLAWMPDGTRLLSGGDEKDPTIREWDTSTWQLAGCPWTEHWDGIPCISVYTAGLLVATASYDNSVRVWRLSDRQNIAIFKLSSCATCVTFSADGKYILIGDVLGNMISEWAVHTEEPLPEEALKKPAYFPVYFPPLRRLVSHLFDSKAEVPDSKILTINTAVRNACIDDDLFTAEELLTREIDADNDNYTSYANRSFVMARKHHWDRAVEDAIKSVTIRPSLIGFISQGIALCGKGQVRDSAKSFDLAFVSANGNPKTAHILFLIKAIALFNANEHEEAIQRVQELAADFPDTDPLACRVVEAYLHVQLGTIALDATHFNDAVGHFTTAVNASGFFSQSPIHSTYEEFTVLFGWDLESLWQTANKQQCVALIRAGRLGEALESYLSMMNASDETAKASLRAWFSTLG